MSAHTPGPWIVKGETWEGDGTGGVWIESEAGEGVAFCTQWTDRGYPDKAQPSDFANAVLISTAPDLLEACETFIAVLRSKIRDGKDRPEYAEAFYQAEKKMDAAIKKARGES